MKNLNIILLSVLLIFVSKSYGQDYHFTQFDVAEQALNPAKTGVGTNSAFRGVTQYRNQWRPLATKPFSTFLLSYDMPISDRFGVGAYMVNNDGAKAFNAFNFVLSGSYKIMDPKQKKHLLTTGLQIGVLYKKTSDFDLLFDNQYNSGKFSAELESNENLTKFSKTMPEFNFGAYYEWTDKANIYHPYAGISIFHLSSPKESLIESADNSQLPRRFVFNGGSKFNITDEIDVNLKSLYMYQGNAKELVIGLSGKYKFTENNMEAILGSNWRKDDAVSILVGVKYQDLTFLISYDITTSQLNEFNNSNGGIEFTLVYSPSGKSSFGSSRFR